MFYLIKKGVVVDKEVTETLLYEDKESFWVWSGINSYPVGAAYDKKTHMFFEDYSC